MTRRIKKQQRREHKLLNAGGGGVQRKWGFLDGALAAATDPRLAWTSQPSATVSVYTVAATGVMTDSTDNITVYSKMDSAIDANTYVECIFMQGKWQLRFANCEASF